MSMSALTRWLYGPKRYKVLLMGERGCGKTTFLDRLKFNRVWESPNPTVGVNVETVEYPIGCFWDFWEIGGGSQDPQQLAYSHLAPTTIVLYLHDYQNSSDQVPESFLTMLENMVETGSQYLWITFNKQGGGRWRSSDMVKKLTEAYEAELDKFQKNISGNILTHMMDPSSARGTFNVMEDLFSNMENVKDMFTHCSTPRPKHMTTLQHNVEREISQDTLDAESFWVAFLNRGPLVWSHYNFLRALYMLVLDSAKDDAECSEIADRFTGYAKGLEEKSPDWFQRTQNRTMVMFWILQIQYTARDHRNSKRMNGVPSRGDFPLFLRQTPKVMDDLLWKEHFSPDEFFSLRAKEQWRPPRWKPLVWVSFQERTSQDVSAQQEDPDRLLRYAFEILQYMHRSGLQRIGLTARALACFEKSTMRARKTRPEIPAYSETQAYFWLQLVQIALQNLYSLYPEAQAQDQEKQLHHDSLSRLRLEGFKDLFHINSDTWKNFYSSRVWNGMEGRLKYIPPDLKQLHASSLWTQVSSNELAEQLEVILTTEDEGPRLPSVEALSFQATLVIQWAQELDATSPVIVNHTHLLLYLFQTLVADIKGSIELPQSSGRIPQALVHFSKVSGSLIDSVTHRNFWFQQFLAAVAQAESKKPQEGTPSAKATFADFVMNNLDLVNEDLPSQYYSPEVWQSEEAKETIVAPDREEMQNIVEMNIVSDIDEWVQV